MLGAYHMQLAPAGAADLTGILPDGRRLEVELKRRDGKGVQSPDQIEWEKFINDNNGVYIIVKSGEEFRKKIEEFI